MLKIPSTHIFRCKMWIRFAALLISLSVSLPAAAAYGEVGNFKYNFSDNGKCSVAGLASGVTLEESGELNIPETVEYDGKTYTVTGIEDNAFSYRITYKCILSIPNTVTFIGASAFYNCWGLIGSLTIPESVISIGKQAFYNCGFTGTLTLSKSMTTIADGTFSGCKKLSGSLILPKAITSIGASAFNECCGFTGSLIIPNAVTSIGDSAFKGCSGFTESLSIPSAVTTIGTYTFQDCSGFTGTLTLPENLISIGEYAFSGCSGFTGSLILPKSLTSIARFAFNGCTNFSGSLTIPEGISLIGEYAFLDCSNITGTLTLPKSLTTIEAGVFYRCSGFTGCLTIPENITSIGRYAFSKCSGLTGSLTIPKSVTTIGRNAFSNCSGFDGTLSLPKSLSELSSKTFYQCSSMKVIICEAATPPSITPANSTDAFGGTPNYFNNVVLYVPKESIDKYKETTPWKNFKNIKSLDEAPSSSIERVESDEESGVTVEGGDIMITGSGVAEVYNLAGVRVAQITSGRVCGLPHGIYIVSVNGKVHKVAL